MNEEESLYKTIILALIIGIVVVVLTLVLTRPEQETFTELYFNDHQNLPDYIDQNEEYSYSFTIANHEKSGIEYVYNKTQELIKLDYSCEDTILYLQKSNESKYLEFIDGYDDVDTWSTKTTDPLLYIKDDSYAIKMSYQVKSGAGQVVLGLRGLDDNDKYVLVINENKNKAYFMTRKQKIEIDINESLALSRRVAITAENGTLVIELDNQRLVELSNIKEFNKGFLFLEMTHTYAKLWSPVIERETTKQVVNLQFGGIQYVSVPLEVTQTLQQRILFYQAPNDQDTVSGELSTESNELNLDAELNPDAEQFAEGSPQLADNGSLNADNVSLPAEDSPQPADNGSQNADSSPLPADFNATKNTYYYYVGQPFNMTRYTMESVFRLIDGEQFSMGSESNYALGFFPLDYKVLFTYKSNGENKTMNLSLPKRIRGWHSVMVDVDNEIIKVYFDSVLSAVINDSDYSESATPFLRTDDDRAVVQNFYAESNVEPLKYNYNIPKSGSEQRRYTRIYDPRLISRPDQPEEERDPIDEELEYVYQANRIDWENYAANIIYVDPEKENSMFIAFNDLEETIYSLFLEDNTANFTFWENGIKKSEVKNVTLNETFTHRVEFDIEGNNITVRMNFEKLWEKTIDKTSGGLLLLNHSENVSVTNTDIENRDSNEIRVYQKPQPKCKPISSKTFSETAAVYIAKGDELMLEESFNINEDFDIGIISVLLSEEQEIHFLVSMK